MSKVRSPTGPSIPQPPEIPPYIGETEKNLIPTEEKSKTPTPERLRDK